MTQALFSDDMNDYLLLRSKVEQLNQMYYNESLSLVSDAAYDGLKRELQRLEQVLKIDDTTSPTQTVGHLPSSSFAKVAHLTPMLSLGNVYNEEELREWINGLPAGVRLTVEPKIDGLSLDIVYENGSLKRAVTRGDGLIGEDVTENALHVWGIPTRITEFLTKGLVEVRGEVVVRRDVFEAVQQKREANGETRHANPRNYASGSLRLKNPLEVIERRLNFIAYDYIAEIDSTHVVGPHRLGLLDFCGFTTSQPLMLSHSDDFWQIVTTLTENRLDYPWDIDGLVFKVEQQEVRRQLGERSNSPRWATAYKFPAQEGVATLLDIHFQIGKSGVATPVAAITPTHVCGVTISNITLHNVAEIERLELKVGDKVAISRRGDVIPKIESVLMVLRDGYERPIVYPEHCPSCGCELERVTHSLYCNNHTGCPDQAVARLAHFVSRNGMDIRGLGESAVTELVKHGLVLSFASLFYLGDEDLKLVYPNSEVTRRKVLESIAAAKTQYFRKVLFAVGIPEVGEGTSERLAAVYPNFEALCNATLAELMDITDIGEITALSIHATCQADRKEFISYDRLFTYVPEVVEEAAEKDLEGKVVLVSGKTFLVGQGPLTLNRQEMERNVKSRGGKLASGISKNVDLFFAGHGAGAEKVTKAIKLGFIKESQEVYRNPFKE